MQKLFFTYITLFLCVTSVAQSNFHKIYDFNNQSDGGRKIIETDQGFIVFGVSDGMFSKFLKVDTLGNVLFNNHYSIRNDDLRAGGLWNSGYVGFGEHFDTIEGARDSHLFFINDLGDSLKVITIDFEFNDQIWDALLLKDSTFIVLGTFADSNATNIKPFVAHVDSLGSVLWMKTHDDSTIQEVVNNIEATKDGGYIYGGREEENPNGFQDLFLVKLDSLGNFEWKKNYGRPGLSEFSGHVTVCKNGEYAIAGSIVNLIGTPPFQTGDGQRGLRRVDSVGNLIWEKDFGTTNYHEQFTLARELPNGDFICAGSSFHTYNNQDIPDVNLTRLDSAGNLLWSEDFTFTTSGPQVHDYVLDLQITSDSGFVMTGFITNVSGPSLNDVFIIKTDGNGLITSLNSGFREVPTAWKIYPNPTQGQITIPESKEIKQIHVFNLQGQQVQEVSPNVIGATKVQLQGAPGVYIIQIQMKDGSVESAKVIKQ